MPTDLAIASAAGAQEEAAPAEDRRAIAWTTSVIAVIVVMLALFSAESMRSWSETLSPTPTNLAIRQASESWFDLTQRLGLAAPRAALHATWQSARNARFVPDPVEAEPAQPQR